MKIVRVLLSILLVVAVFVAGFGYGRWYGKSAAGAAQKGGRKILYYVDPMHPAYKSDKPGIAPDCGMKLEPIYEEGGASAPTATDEQAALPMGTIKINADKQQLIGVSYGQVESGAGVRTFRAVGKVAFDETRVARVHARVEGWIDQVFVDFTGQLVTKGQRLLTLYSPEMLATQQEYLLALKSKDMLKNSTFEDALRQTDSLTAASRKRLELWDLSDAQIEEIARTGKPVTNITLNSPIGGYVIARNAFSQQKITPETELYNIVDLSRIWIMADVFENEAPMIRLNQQATVSIANGRGKSFRAMVNYIQPQVDPMTRTLKVRLEAENPEMLLKPDMYADVEFRVEMPGRITVPSAAVLNSGERQTVFVDRGNGYLEPRQVEIGERIGDRLEILKGLKPGERIVVSGNFLIDSESQLKAAAGGMAGMPGMPGTPDSTPKSGGPKPPAQPTQESMPGMPGMPATPEPKK
jgi:RND family efflux transporter MFP subunit